MPVYRFLKEPLIQNGNIASVPIGLISLKIEKNYEKHYNIRSKRDENNL